MMLLPKLLLFALVLYVTEASKMDESKKKTASAPNRTPSPNIDLASTAPLASTTTTSTTAATTTTTTSTLTTPSPQVASSFTSISNDFGTKAAFDREITVISKMAMKERAGNMNYMLAWCKDSSFPTPRLDRLVADHSVCITDTSRIHKIFSKLNSLVTSILPHISMMPEDVRAVFFHDKLYDIMLSKFPACAFTPERLLSLDFAALPDLKIKDAIAHAEFLKLLLEPRDDSLSLPAVYMLNAFLQLDSMLHSFLLKKHKHEELVPLFQARQDLFRITCKRAHYERVCRLMPSSLSKTVRMAMSNAHVEISITRALESVDAIVSQGATHELRACVYAKGMSVFLLTEDAVQLQSCNDPQVCQEAYVTFDFPLWLMDLISFLQLACPISRFDSTVESALASGNRKFIHNIVDYLPVSRLSEGIKRISYDQKFSASPDLACKVYLTINFMMTSFQPLMKEINTKQLSLKECLNRKIAQQPKCIYESIVRTFAAFELPQSSEELHDLVKFLFKDHIGHKFSNNDITQELHGTVHEMIVTKTGGEFHEDILLRLMSIDLRTFTDFVNNQTYAFPGRKASLAIDTKSENIVRDSLTKRNYVFRERNSYQRLGMTDDPNGLNHLYIANLHASIILKRSTNEIFESFHGYYTLTSLARTLSSVCKPDNQNDTQEAHEKALIRKADHIVKVLCTNPLLFSSFSLQELLAKTVNETLYSETVPYVKATVTAFVWDYCATKGIDTSCFLKNIQLSDNFPNVATHSKMLVQSRVECNFAYMSLMPLMLMACSSSDVPISELTFAFDCLRSAIGIFMKDQNVAPHYHHAMITTISRAIMQFEPELTSSLLSKHWNHPRLIEALELLPYDKVRDISSNSKLFGPMALSALLSRHGKAFLFDENTGPADYAQFMVELLEHDDKLNDAHFVQGYSNFFIAFIREAVVLAPGVLKVETSSDRVYTRLQFLFIPSFEFKESDSSGLENCTIQRKVVHRMIKEIIDTDNSEVYAILIQVLYRHYKYCKIWLSTNTLFLKEKEKLETKHLMHQVSQLYSSQPIKENSSQNFAVTASLAGPLSASNASKPNASKPLQEPNTTIQLTTVTLTSKTVISGTTISENNETPVKPKELHIKKANLPRKNTAKEIEEDYEDSFNFMAPTPKKTIQKVTDLKDDIASYFKCSTNGIRAPSPSLRLGTHELLLNHASAKGFPFLLNENFYNFLVGQEYILDTSSFGNQLDAWIEAKQKVPMNNQMTRLGLWMPSDSKSVTVSKNYPLHGELEKLLNENIEIRNRLVSLLQNSIQGKKSFARISVLSKPLVQKIEVQNGTLSLDSSVSAEILPQLLSDFLTLKMQPIVEEQVSLESGDNGTQSVPKTETTEEPNVSQMMTSITTTVNSDFNEGLIGKNYMAYDGQLQEINSDIDTQAKRIRVLRAQELGNKSSFGNDYKQRLQNMKAGNAEKRFVERRLNELVRLISSADYIAVDFELTGVSLNNGSDPSGFEECKQSVKENSIVQVGLMLMKKDESDSLVQEESGKSIWKIPLCLKGNTDDSIWRKNSLDFLKANGFDLLAWKVQCLEYSQLDAIWKALLEKPILTHNGLLDVLHLLRAAGREIKNVHSIDEFKNFLNNSGINVYDTRVLYIQTHPHFSLTKLSEAVLPRDKLKAGSAHDASYDAYCTGHLCRFFSTASLSSSRNVLMETKRGVKKVQTSQTSSSSSQSAQHITNDAPDTPVRPNVTKRISKTLSQTCNSSSLALQDPRTYQEFIPNPLYHHSTVYYTPPLQQQQQSYLNGQSLNSPTTLQMQTSHFDTPQPIRWPLRFQQDSFQLNSTAKNSNEKKT